MLKACKLWQLRVFRVLTKFTLKTFQIISFRVGHLKYPFCLHLDELTGSVIKFIYDADFKDVNVPIKLLYLKSRFIKSFTQLELRLREPILCQQKNTAP